LHSVIGHYLTRNDAVYRTESSDGYRLTPYNPQFETRMTAARTIIKKRRVALSRLAASYAFGVSRNRLRS
jgi:hypothetical protein